MCYTDWKPNDAVFNHPRQPASRPPRWFVFDASF